MKEIWVLSIKTSLPDVCESSKDLKCEMFAFETFEKARDAFREKLKGYGFSKNTMFDGKGKLRLFTQYIKEMDKEDFEDEEISPYKAFSTVNEALTAMIAGENAPLNLPNGSYTDYSIAVDVEDGSVFFYGDDDGPYNGYDPKLQTNAFSMETAKDYYLYIDDLFGQDEATSELYIDLKKTQLN